MRPTSIYRGGKWITLVEQADNPYRDLPDTEQHPDARHLLRNGMNRVVLTDAQRKSFQTLLGDEIYDMHDVKRKMKQDDFRIIETGERQDLGRKKVRDWVESGGPKERGRLPQEDTLFSGNRVDIHEIHRQIREGKR